MRRPLAVIAIALTLLALTLACGPSRLFGGNSLGEYVSEVGGPVQEFAAWAQEVLSFSNSVLQTRDAEAICSDSELPALVERGADITAQLDSIEPPAALKTPHDTVRNAASSVVTSLGSANERICEKKDLEGGLAELTDALGPIEELLGKLQDLQKLLPSP